MKYKIKRALISVSDKKNIEIFAKGLTDLGISLISTGGTSTLLRTADIPHQQVEEITNFPESFDGRLKTLHPMIQGGILGQRDVHAKEAEDQGIEWIDLVVVNFYPFQDAIKNKNLSLEDAIEYIDVGGPTMVRAAAKNFKWVAVVTDPNDYPMILEALQKEDEIHLATKIKLAEKAFKLTAQYDGMIYRYFNQCEHMQIDLEKKLDLRYGENPHQKAAAYEFSACSNGVLSAKIHQGKPLSYNNILDTEAALNCVNEFKVPACVIVKHANPCGAATALTIDLAYEKAFAADPISAFGGIIAVNRTCDAKLARAMIGHFIEVVLAPKYTEEALKIFATKPNIRVLALTMTPNESPEMRFINGGVLIQERDQSQLVAADLKVVTQITPSKEEIETILFAWPILKHIKSNAILIAKNDATLGIGGGQVSRIDAVRLAVTKAGEGIKGAILASDAFFPFRDSIDFIGKTGIKAIVQPGGSVRDPEVIAACNEYGIAMVFTGVRCFKH